jgi:hypothetical protein
MIRPTSPVSPFAPIAGIEGLPPNAGRPVNLERPVNRDGRVNREGPVNLEGHRPVTPRSVAVVGCGIGGLTTAIALRRAALDVHVYEQADELGEVGAGVGMWPNALRALEPLGLADAVLSLSGGAIGSALRRPDGRYLLRQPSDVVKARWGASFISVHRAELHALLAANLDPATIHLGARCTGFEQTHRTVRVHFDGGSDVEADILVGADGVRSVVRSQVAGPARLRYRAAPTGGGSPPRDRFGPSARQWRHGDVEPTWASSRPVADESFVTPDPTLLRAAGTTTTPTTGCFRRSAAGTSHSRP